MRAASVTASTLGLAATLFLIVPVPALLDLLSRLGERLPSGSGLLTLGAGLAADVLMIAYARVVPRVSPLLVACFLALAGLQVSALLRYGEQASSSDPNLLSLASFTLGLGAALGLRQRAPTVLVTVGALCALMALLMRRYVVSGSLYRVQGIHGTSVTAMLLAVILPLSIAIALRGTSARPRTALAFSLVVSLALAMTFSRGPAAAALVGVLCLLGAGRGRPEYLVALASSVAVLGVCLVARSHDARSLASTEASNAGRAALLSAATRRLPDHWAFGAPGDTPVLEIVNPATGRRTGAADAHCLPVDVALRYGAAGLMVLALFVLGVAQAARGEGPAAFPGLRAVWATVAVLSLVESPFLTLRTFPLTLALGILAGATLVGVGPRLAPPPNYRMT